MITRRITTLLIAGALALSACSMGSGTPTTDSGATSGTTTGGTDAQGHPASMTEINFFTDKAAWEPSFDDMNGASEASNMKLKFTGYSDPTAYDSFIKQSFRTKSVPDLFTWHTGAQLEELVKQGLVAETSDIWTKAEADGLVPQGLKDNYTYDGKQYCVPLNVVYWAMYYNKKSFEKHGIEVPKTWEELMAAAKKLKDAGETPFHQMNFIFEFVWFQAMLMGQNPATYEGLQDNSAKYTDEDVVKVMQQWQKMIKDGYYVDPGVQTDPQTLLNTGQVAMAYFGTFFTGQLTGIGAKSGEDFGIFVIPNMNPDVKQPQMALETGPLCVGKGSANEQAALQYSTWWLGDDAQTKWSSSRGDISFNPNVKIADPELAALVTQVNDKGNDFKIQKRYLEATPLPVYKVETEVFGKFVTDGQDYQGALDKLQKAADEYWANR